MNLSTTIADQGGFTNTYKFNKDGSCETMIIVNIGSRTTAVTQYGSYSIKDNYLTIQWEQLRQTVIENTITIEDNISPDGSFEEHKYSLEADILTFFGTDKNYLYTRY